VTPGPFRAVLLGLATLFLMPVLALAFTEWMALLFDIGNAQSLGAFLTFVGCLFTVPVAVFFGLEGFDE